MTREELLEVIDKAKQSGQKSLDLSRKQIKELPPEIGQLSNLASLDLRGNKLIASGIRNSSPAIVRLVKAPKRPMIIP